MDLAASLIFNGMTSKELDFFLKLLVQSDPFRFLGALILPIPVDAYLWGLMAIMCVTYFNSRTNRMAKGWKKWPLRLFVGWVGLAATAVTMNLWIWSTKALVIQYGTFHEIYDPTFYSVFYIASFLLAMPCQAFWTYRIWKAHNNNYIFAGLMFGVMLLIAAVQMIMTAQIMQDTTLMATAARPLFVLALRISIWAYAGGHLLGCGLSIWGLYKQGLLADYKKNKWGTFLLVGAESFFLTTVMSVFVTLLYICAGRVDAAVPVVMVSSKCYAISILHVLNHYADVKEAAELENMDEVGTYLDHKRNSRITNPAILQLGALSKNARRYQAYQDDFDKDLNVLPRDRDHETLDVSHLGMDSTNSLVEYKGGYPYERTESSRSVKSSDEHKL